jgi:hypothetical protein
MKRDEIEFCEWWLGADVRTIRAYNEHRGPYGDYWKPVWSGLLVAERPSMEGPASLGPRGADLVGSYQAAQAQGLEIKPDPGPGELPPWLAEETAGDRRTDHVVCDCDDGFVNVTVEHGMGRFGGIHRSWPAKCPKCNVNRGQAGVDLVWEKPGEQVEYLGRPLRGLGETMTDRMMGPPLGVIDDGWRQLTRAEGQRLAGKHFEARMDADDPPSLFQAKMSQIDRKRLRVVGGCALPFDGSWWVRDAIRAKPAAPLAAVSIDDDWVTERGLTTDALAATIHAIIGPRPETTPAADEGVA